MNASKLIEDVAYLGFLSAGTAEETNAVCSLNRTRHL
jgi:hypothetical protein